MSYTLTYASMFDPPESLHAQFDLAMQRVRQRLGGLHALHIDGIDLPSQYLDLRRSPIDQRLVLGEFSIASRGDVKTAISAAQEAYPLWRRTPVSERARLLRRVADLLQERVYEIAAALTLEVGKNRMEALGEAQETVEFFRLYANEFEQADGFEHALPNDPLPGFASRNRSVMRPYGVWAVISPFNFPLALAGGPVAAALITGNTVVLKTASETPWAGRLLADCMRDAGLPPGVFNYLNGQGHDVGTALVNDTRLAGITFTGSYDVGMQILRLFASGPYPRPCIAEMGGKNACIVTAHADLDRATLGIVRSAFGMGGQKCSALSRLYVAARVADSLIGRLRDAMRTLQIGDPSQRAHWLGPVTTADAYANYPRYIDELSQQGARILAGGQVLHDAELVHGYYVQPTLAEAPSAHPLYAKEMFLPILMLCRVDDLDHALQLANDSPLGLTAGCYGSNADIDHFQEHIEAGVTYANRPQGATTGAWPGYQPFAGWKGSGTTGKAIASFYYLSQYLREQSRTVVD
ncbi:MAG: aldehyde dehydrogenase family protein [Xanthomonadales bacterium]|jgi:acyl-CoA reductase-like NAD-dependent aldehyde dehydrogenase|nr:aldehyde dehydrogenase family protein [Xanthomonadales bacterium]